MTTIVLSNGHLRAETIEPAIDALIEMLGDHPLNRKIVTAMPQVKPTVTGWGMWRISEPSRESPISVSIAPESITVTRRPFSPNFDVVAATSTMKAPAGPPI